MSSTSDTVEVILKAKDEASKAFEAVSGKLDAFREKVRGIGDIAIGNVLGNLGVQGIDSAIRGMRDFGTSLIDTNANIELMRQRLNILYQSTAEGAQAFAFLKNNELTKPFDIQSILDASTQLVAFKQDITSVLPALEDIAGAMGQSLPVAARAFNDALMGRFVMLKNDLGVSKEQLVQFGLELNKAGHITNPESFTKAFLALANSGEFKGGADKLAQTWTGLMSSMSSQWMYFKANLGGGAFAVLEKQLSGMVHTLQDPANAAGIQRFEQQLGAGLGQATAAALQFGRTLGPYIGSAVVFAARAWPLLTHAASEAFAALGTVVGTFGNWLQSTGYPAIARVINAIGQAWQDVVPPVLKVLGTLGTDFGVFVTAVSSQAGPLMQGLAGAFRIGLGAVQAVFGGALDLLSGNWAKFQNDLSNGADLIATGVVQAFGGLAAAMVPLANNLFGPWTALAIGIRKVFNQIGDVVGGWAGGIVQGFLTLVDKLYAPWTTLAIGIRSVFDGIGGIVGAFVGMMVKAGTDIGNALLTPLNKAIDAMRGAGSVLDKIPGMSHIPGLGQAAGGLANMRELTLGGGQQNANAASKAVTDWFNTHAPGIDKNQTLHAGIDPAQVGKDISAAFTDWFRRNAPGIDPNQRITGGRTVQQAQADIAAKTQEIVLGMGLKPGEAKGVTFSTSGGAGKDVLDEIKALFKGLGGKVSFKDLLEALGLKDLGKGKLAFNGPDPNLTLPVLGAGPGGPAAGGAAGTGNARYLFQQRQGLGELQAVFGSVLATPARGDAQDRRDAGRTIAALQEQVRTLQAAVTQRATEEGILRQQLAAARALVGLVGADTNSTPHGPRGVLRGRGVPVPMAG